MLVEDIMSRDPLYVEDSAFLTNARQLIRDNHVRGLPVVNSRGHVIGVVTVQDMLRVTSTKSNVTISGFIAKTPLITEHMNMMDAARIMLSEKHNLLPVVQSIENPVLRGVVSLLDVFRGLDMDGVPDLEISEIMNKKVISASTEDNVTKIWDRMIESDFTGLPVLNDSGEPLGMITRFDILKRGWARLGKEDTTKPPHTLGQKVDKLMSTPLYSLRPEDKLKTAMEMMKKRDIGRISIVDDGGKLVGIVDRYDLIRSFLGELR